MITVLSVVKNSSSTLISSMSEYIYYNSLSLHLHITITTHPKVTNYSNQILLLTPSKLLYIHLSGCYLVNPGPFGLLFGGMDTEYSLKYDFVQQNSKESV